MSNAKVYIYQPLIPHYRVAFFNKLNKKLKGELTVVANKELPNDKSIKSVDIDFPFKVIYSKCFQLIGGVFYWQTKSLSYKTFKKGDIIVLTGNPRFLSNIQLYVIARLKKLKVIWWGHGKTAGSKKSNQAIKKQIMKLMDFVILYTEKEVENICLNGFISKRVIGLNNAIDNAEIKREIKKWTVHNIEKFKIKNDLINKVVFLFCGRVSAKSELLMGVKSFSKLENKEQSIFVIIGEGPELLEVKNYCHNNNITNVVFKGAIYNESGLAPWFLSADYFIYPGSIGLSLLHAFNYGLPAITHDNDEYQMPEIAALKDNYNGIRYKHKDIESLKDILLLAINQPKIRSDLSLGAFKTIEDSFNLENMVAKFHQAIRSV